MEARTETALLIQESGHQDPALEEPEEEQSPEREEQEEHVPGTEEPC